MTDAAFALYAAAECFACAISSSDLEEGVKYAEAAIAALPPGGFPRPDYVRELVEDAPQFFPDSPQPPVCLARGRSFRGSASLA
jgi:hypothetical protein